MYPMNEAARQLGITYQSLNKWIRKLGINTTKSGRFSYLSDTDFQRIKNIRDEQSASSTHHSDGFYLDRIRFLESHIEGLRQNLDREQQLCGAKERRIEELTTKLKMLETNPYKETVSIAPEIINQWEKTRDTIASLQNKLHQRYQVKT